MPLQSMRKRRRSKFGCIYGCTILILIGMGMTLAGLLMGLATIFN